MEINTPVGVIEGENEVYRGQGFSVAERQIKISDQESRDHDLIKRPKDYVVVIALTEDGQIVTLDQSKFAQMDVFPVFPSGEIKKGETKQEAAARELFGESGYKANSYIVLNDRPFAPFPDKIDTRDERNIYHGHFFILAMGARKEGKATESENSTTVLRSIEQVEAILDGALATQALIVMETTLAGILALRYVKLNLPDEHYEE